MRDRPGLSRPHGRGRSRLRSAARAFHRATDGRSRRCRSDRGTPRGVLAVAAHGQELATELSRAAGRVQNALQVFPRDVAEAALFEHQAAHHRDRSEGVVDLVCDAAGEAADRVHLACLEKLLAEPVLLDFRSPSLSQLLVGVRKRSPRPFAAHLVAGAEKGDLAVRLCARCEEHRGQRDRQPEGDGLCPELRRRRQMKARQEPRASDDRVERDIHPAEAKKRLRRRSSRPDGSRRQPRRSEPSWRGCRRRGGGKARPIAWTWRWIGGMAFQARAAPRHVPAATMSYTTIARARGGSVRRSTTAFPPRMALTQRRRVGIAPTSAALRGARSAPGSCSTGGVLDIGRSTARPAGRIEKGARPEVTAARGRRISQRERFLRPPRKLGYSWTRTTSRRALRPNHRGEPSDDLDPSYTCVSDRSRERAFRGRLLRRVRAPAAPSPRRGRGRSRRAAACAARSGRGGPCGAEP